MVISIVASHGLAQPAVFLERVTYVYLLPTQTIPVAYHLKEREEGRVQEWLVVVVVVIIMAV